MKIFGYNVEECLTFFMLVVVGYFIAKLFSQKCNGFSVGAQIECDKIKNPTNCRRHRIHGCELKDDKCTYKNAPAPAGKKDNGSGCNNNNDCKSGYCNMNVKMPNSNGMCEVKQECINDKQKPPRCDTCINDLHQYPDCKECKNDLYQYPDCKECKNDKQKPPDCKKCKNDKQKPPDCKKCINDKHQYPDCTECKEGHKRYPLCTGLKECNELNNVWCGFHPFCKLDKITGKCTRK